MPESSQPNATLLPLHSLDRHLLSLGSSPWLSWEAHVISGFRMFVVLSLDPVSKLQPDGLLPRFQLLLGGSSLLCRAPLPLLWAPSSALPLPPRTFPSTPPCFAPSEFLQYRKKEELGVWLFLSRLAQIWKQFLSSWGKSYLSN